jgi:outer membrane receptor protein involved in Fe transport
MKRFVLALFALGLLTSRSATAQDAAQGAAAPPKDDEPIKREEVIVVSASKTETTLINAPATMSVVSADVLATTPAQNFGDLLRSVPGLNVIQTSARDINMTSRASTSTLTNSTLVMLDGRSLYLDFFGLVLWDFVPQSQSEIKQIEVVRGPASAVWGANALTGVVNIISKTPREAEGFALNLNGGLFNRSEGSRSDDGSGYTGGGNFSYAKAPSEKLSYRLSAGYFYSDPMSRPTGIVGGCPAGRACVPHPLDSSILTGGAVYPVDGAAGFENNGTSQPKADLRVDQEFDNGGRLTYQGGYAGTKGIVHTGIGPFNIESGSYLAYGKLNYSKNALKVNFFSNFVDAKAPSLLNIDPETIEAVQLNFKTQTYDFEVGNSNVIAGKHILSYGGNARRNNFDITLTPNSEDRNEFGAYLQEEFFTEHFRLAAGVRVDKFGNLDDAVFSPRLSLMVKPTKDHSVRLSFNRAFRSPSVVNNYLDQNILSTTIVPLNLLAGFLPPPLRPAAVPFRLQVHTFGNTGLKEESLDAYEIAYTGTVGGRTTLGLAVYRNDTNENINFTYLNQIPLATGIANGLTFYSPSDPAKGITVIPPTFALGVPYTAPPQIMGILPLVPPPIGPIFLPKDVATYLNLGPLRNEGLEASIEHSFSNEVSAFANYSYQKTPKVLDPDSDQIRYPTAEVGIPAKNRFNLGVNFNTKKFLGSASVNYSDKAFWVDVLDNPNWGYTDSYTMVNASLGMKFNEGKVIASLKGTNLTNSTIQQHVYGDVMKLSVAAEVRIFVK